MEFEVKGNIYQVSQLDAISQFHIVRRLAPVLGKIASLFESEKTESPLENLESLSLAISEMSDEDANYCIFTLLKRVKRKQAQGLGWAPVSSSNRQLMFDDIDMSSMLHIIAKAIQFNFIDFFQESPFASNDA